MANPLRQVVHLTHRSHRHTKTLESILPKYVANHNTVIVRGTTAILSLVFDVPRTSDSKLWGGIVGMTMRLAHKRLSQEV